MEAEGLLLKVPYEHLKSSVKERTRQVTSEVAAAVDLLSSRVLDGFVARSAPVTNSEAAAARASEAAPAAAAEATVGSGHKAGGAGGGGCPGGEHFGGGGGGGGGAAVDDDVVWELRERTADDNVLREMEERLLRLKRKLGQGRTLVPISAQLELFCPTYSPT
jgi:hypothetical protein